MRTRSPGAAAKGRAIRFFQRRKNRIAAAPLVKKRVYHATTLPAASCGEFTLKKLDWQRDIPQQIVPKVTIGALDELSAGGVSALATAGNEFRNVQLN